MPPAFGHPNPAKALVGIALPQPGHVSQRKMVTGCPLQPTNMAGFFLNRPKTGTFKQTHMRLYVYIHMYIYIYIHTHTRYSSIWYSVYTDMIYLFVTCERPFFAGEGAHTTIENHSCPRPKSIFLGLASINKSCMPSLRGWEGYTGLSTRHRIWQLCHLAAVPFSSYAIYVFFLDTFFTLW